MPTKSKKKAEPEKKEDTNHFMYHEDGLGVPKGQPHIFVFGSNLAGFHGAGAAKHALDYYGAKIGWEGGKGLHGQSYAIPTKNQWLQSLDMGEVAAGIKMFVDFTKERKDLKFWVTRVGCGLAGNKDEDVAPLFLEAENCVFPDTWTHILESEWEVKKDE